MRRAAEFAVFLSLAAGLHLAVAAFGPQAEGAQSAGQGGDAAVSLQAASAELSEMVARWDTPPEVTEQTPERISEPELQQADPPPVPLAALDVPPVPAPQGPGLQMPQSDSVPDRTVTEPAPPPETPEKIRMSEVRPQERPPELRKPAPAKPKAQSNAHPKVEPRKQKPAPASRSSAAQRASGAGGSTNAGTGQNTGAATLSAGQRQSLFAQWGAQVRRKIESGKRYPSSARGATGTVQISITVGRDGSLHKVSVVGSSGSSALDDAAMRAVKSARRFPRAPAQLTDPTYTFTLAMQFNA